MQWCTDGIEPTYSIGDTKAWLLDGRIELETDEPAPIRAWAEFVPPKTRSTRKMLGTFHLDTAGGAFSVRAWRCRVRVNLAKSGGSGEAMASSPLRPDYVLAMLVGP